LNAYSSAAAIPVVGYIIARLNERLDEPFVTVNTVTGDKGIKQAQDEYQRLMNNKSPKSKRK
jgi:hypothetical protein